MGSHWEVREDSILGSWPWVLGGLPVCGLPLRLDGDMLNVESRNTEWRVENYGAELRPSSYEGLIQRFFQSFNPFTVASLIVKKSKKLLQGVSIHVWLSPGY